MKLSLTRHAIFVDNWESEMYGADTFVYWTFTDGRNHFIWDTILDDMEADDASSAIKSIKESMLSEMEYHTKSLDKIYHYMKEVEKFEKLPGTR